MITYRRPIGERLRRFGGERFRVDGERERLRSATAGREVRSRDRLRRDFLSRERLRRLAFLAGRGDRLCRRSRSRDERLRSRSFERRRSPRCSPSRSLSLSDRDRSFSCDEDSNASRSRDFVLNSPNKTHIKHNISMLQSHFTYRDRLRTPLSRLRLLPPSPPL